MPAYEWLQHPRVWELKLYREGLRKGANPLIDGLSSMASPLVLGLTHSLYIQLSHLGRERVKHLLNNLPLSPTWISSYAQPLSPFRDR